MIITRPENLSGGISVVCNASDQYLRLAEQLELTIKGIEWQLKQLKENNIIRRVGADKGGYWEIVN